VIAVASSPWPGTTERFFTAPLADVDAEVAAAIAAEEERQRTQIELIAPKNYMSRAAREGLASLMAFTSVEGYPGERWHAGTVNLDVIEELAASRARQLFRCRYANVQPHSGTQANQAVFFGLLEPGDTVLSMSLRDGGHLSHGDPQNVSGRWFRVASYGVRPDDGRVDYDDLVAIAERERPRLIIVGGSSYPRAIDFARCRGIADSVGAFLLADIAHFSGLVAARAYPDPLGHVHAVSTSTNKNLRGPRGGLVLSDDEAVAPRLHRGVFPGIQGGPLPEYMTAKAICFGEALQPEFQSWAMAVLDNARVLCQVLGERGYHVVTGGTDTPLVLVDLRSKGLTGDLVQTRLEAVGLPCNKNLVPGDSEALEVTSGVRFGTSGVTTRGLRAPEVLRLGEVIADVLDDLAIGRDGTEEVATSARTTVAELASAFPLYPGEVGST
jgi:glycine hydroxymethyltransferase